MRRIAVDLRSVTFLDSTTLALLLEASERQRARGGELLILVGPICLAAYALPATQRITNGWLKVLLAILVVRFAWTIVFVLFSLEALGHIGIDGNPPTVGDTNALLGLATGCALLMFLLPFALIPAALSGPGPLRTETDQVLAAYGRHVTLEGPEVEGIVVAEFPSVEEARAWYDSPAYREVAEYRFRGAVYRGLIVEGV